MIVILVSFYFVNRKRYEHSLIIYWTSLVQMWFFPAAPRLINVTIVPIHLSMVKLESGQALFEANLTNDQTIPDINMFLHETLIKMC